jgi:hypothetical protein
MDRVLVLRERRCSIHPLFPCAGVAEEIAPRTAQDQTLGPQRDQRTGALGKGLAVLGFGWRAVDLWMEL